MLRICIACCLALISFAANAQSIRDVVVDSGHNGRILGDFLLEMEALHGIDFICDIARMRTYTLTGITEKRRLTDILEDYLGGSYKTFRYSEQVIFIVDRAIAEKYTLKRENFLLFPERDRGRVTVKGTVSDGLSHEPLVSAKVNLPQFQRMVASDINGQFDLGRVEGEIIEVDVEYVGYEPNHYIVGFSPSGTQKDISVDLWPQSTELESVTITAKRVEENVMAKITGVESLSITALKAVPAFMGEVDPIRSLTALPGVSTPGELASGFNVRGGELGQNLVMQEGAIIYNPSHLFGFFSAFNPDMVSGVTLYKGGGPANFGSRIASILDVSLRNGDASKHSLSGGIGLISSRITVEGPILRNRSSYVIGGRFSYPNWLVKATDNISLRNSTASFQDYTGKIFHTVNENNYVTLTGYHSYDDFKLATDSVFSWSTTNVSVKWDHTFHETLFSTLTAFSSNYASQVHSISQIEGYEYDNSIRSIGMKYDLNHSFEDHSKVTIGMEANGTVVEPGRLTPDPGVENISPDDMQNQHSLETALYFQWDRDLRDKWSVAAGLRYGYFLRLGPEQIYVFDYQRMDGRYPAMGDTIGYAVGEPIKKYSALEPRISIRYLMNNSTSLKASFYRGYQYLHLISNTSSSTPQDYWVTSGPHLKPQRGDQYSLGVFKNLSGDNYELSVEGFYKEVDNAVDYMEGADITLNPALEAGLLQGEGQAHGLEVLVKKNRGRTNGWISYTYSRSLRRFWGEDTGATINSGSWYPSAFDQPHHLTFIVNHQLGLRTSLSANFTYSTGRPITIPVSKFSYDVYLSVLNYSERNDYRIPDYHRLDVSLTIEDKPKSNKRFRSEWVISVFNLYSRRNAYSISFDRYGLASKLSVLGSVFPSINYSFRF